MASASHKSSVLVTGGSNGIGLALAKRYFSSGNTVMVTGRDLMKLREVSAENPGLLIYHSDPNKAEDREALAEHVLKEMPHLNILINNAEYAERISLASDGAARCERQTEINSLLAGPAHLNSRLVPVMLKHGESSMIINVTSDEAYIPQVFEPMYSARKRAMRNDTVILRLALKGTRIRVVEVVPPTTRRNLPEQGSTQGVSLERFADKVFGDLIRGEAETIGLGMKVN